MLNMALGYTRISNAVQISSAPGISAGVTCSQRLEAARRSYSRKKTNEEQTVLMSEIERVIVNWWFCSNRPAMGVMRLPDH